MVAELLPLPLPAPVSPSPAVAAPTCDLTALRLATKALHVAEIALRESAGGPGGAPDRRSVTVLGESTESTDDPAVPAGPGLVELLVAALGIGTGAGPGPDDERELEVTTDRQVHLVRSVPGAAEPRVVHLVLDRDRSTAAQARHVLRRHLASGPLARRPVRRGSPDTAPVAPVIAQHPPRRRTTSIRATGRAVRCGADLRRTSPPAWTRQALPEGSRWSRDDDTLRRLLAGLHAMA